MRAQYLPDGRAELRIARGNEARTETWKDAHEAIARAANLSDGAWAINVPAFINDLFR